MIKCEMCSKLACFGYEGGKACRCATHKEVGMVDVKHKRCEASGCDTLHPAFGMEDGKGMFCAIHKKAGMINLYSKQCQAPNCSRVNPVFDFQGGKGTFCSLHKLDGMIDVKHMRCQAQWCNKQPVYGMEGSRGQFCTLHKMDGMVDTKHPRCMGTGCNKRPSFGVMNGKRIACVLHKDVGMIYLGARHCEIEDCNTQPVYGFQGGKGVRCSRHKTEEMIDVKHPQCESPNCTIRPRYGLPAHKPSHCAKHRLPGMIRRPRAKCATKGCTSLALYGTDMPIHCETHQEEDEKNLVEQECAQCHLTIVVNRKGICEYCDPATFHTTRLAKQNALMSYLDERKLQGSSTDVVVNDGACGRERPDRVYEFPDKIVILECDEYQHRDRACECEQTRMVNIAQGYGGLPVYFLRWNPDAYSPENDRKMPEKITARHKLVGDLIRDIHLHVLQLPVALVSALYLYYDGWDGIQNEQWKIITPFHL